MLADVAAITLGFLGAYWLRRDPLAEGFGEIYPLSRYLWLYLTSLISLLLSLGFLRLYEVDSLRERRATAWRDAARVLLAVGLCYVLVSVVGFSFKLGYVSRLLMSLFMALAALLLILARLSLRPALRRKAQEEPLSVVVVGTGPEALRLASMVAERQLGTRLVGLVSEAPGASALVGDGFPVLGDTSSLGAILAKHVVDDVVFATAGRSFAELAPLLLQCQEQGITARLACDFLPEGSARVYLDHLDGRPLLTFTTTPNNSNLLALKRVLDVALGLALLALLSPLFIVVPILIKLTSKGPIFYRQVRCGLNGRRFTLLKFRSMVEDAEHLRKEVEHLNEAQEPVFKISADPRLTPIGGFLRRSSMDELPQLLQVLSGEMSLVGPRPPLPDEVERYERWQRRRLSMRPGLTCLWQVSGRSELSFDEWVALDLEYIDNWSPGLDLAILFRTIPAVLSGKGAI